MTLDGWGLGKRLLLAVLIIALALLILSIAGQLLSGNAGAQQRPDEPQFYAGVPLDATLLELDKQGLRDAYHEQIKFLFQIWLKGGASSDKEIVAGLKNARRAYNFAAQQIIQREQELLAADKQHHVP
jgi:hypothetical protein